MSNSAGEENASKGNILVHTGEGKGKTTSAIGQIVRARGHGLNAKLVSFFKGNEDRFTRGTFATLEELGVPIRNYVEDHPDFGRTDEEEARYECKKAISHLEEFFRSEGGSFDLLVLDEINVALDGGFVKEEECLSLLDQKPEELELVCTGRGAPDSLIEKADLVSRIENVKHFYDRGVVQRAGFEY